ncbi:MAG: hypothetical protein JWR50_3094, partial [Mucilaginibacter sp.]|nr:hypothetical protein [Mucilaginibacter sp.]
MLCMHNIAILNFMRLSKVNKMNSRLSLLNFYLQDDNLNLIYHYLPTEARACRERVCCLRF